MFWYTFIILSFFVQLAATITPLILLRSKHHPRLKFFLFIPMVIMLVRRSISVYVFFTDPDIEPFSYVAEVLVLFLSVCFIAVIKQCRDLFTALINSQESLRKIAEHLEDQVIERTEQLRKLNAILKTAKEQWELTFDSVPDLILLLDSEYRIIRANKPVLDYLGVREADIVGLPCFTAMHGSMESPEWCPLAQVLSTKKSVSVQTKFDNPDKCLIVSVHPVIDDGQIVGFVHVMRDITELKSIEDQLRQTELDLATLEAAKSLDLLESAQALNAGVAHELRTPMQAILNTVEYIKDLVDYDTVCEDCQALKIDKNDFAELVSDAVDRVLYTIKILNALSTYAKAGRSRDIHLINVVDEIRTVLKTLRFTDKFKHLTDEQLILDLPSEPCSIMINQADFMQALINLCKNAVEAISHEFPRLIIRVRKVGMKIQIHVIDNGSGIPEGLGDSIFRPYYSTKESRVTHSQGLGLSIVKNIVSVHGGSIHYTSRIGYTDFCMTFDCNEGQEEPKE